MSSPAELKNAEKQSDEEQDSYSTDSPTSSHSSSPNTPTNSVLLKDSEHNTAVILKSETSESRSLPNGESNLHSYSASLNNQEAATLGQAASGYGQLPPTMLLPPYKATQSTPEGISLSNYVKMMTLQQGGGAGGPPIYPMPGAFSPAGLLTDAPGSELATVITPTTITPPYQDMGYAAQCLLMNQAQQLGPFPTGFQHHPLAKASQIPAHGIKPVDDKHSHLAYQQDMARMHASSSFRGQASRRSIKRSHDHSMEPDDERGVESGLEQLAERGSQFPAEGDGGRDERRIVNSDAVDRLPHQLKWRAHMVESWQGMCDAALIDIHNIGFQVETDKGFNFSIIDDSFVCQKKNHFQVTVTVLFKRAPKFVKMKNGSIQPIERFTLNLHGIRFEQVNSSIQLEQSRSDRTKIRYTPDMIEIPDNPEKPVKRTVGRLHFSETTHNNMRKRGKPNPEQKYFSLVVALHAETPDNSLPVCAHVSERIVVRASNPGNFDSDSDYLWYKCSNPENIFHHGRVGINTDKPDEALTVHGNIQVTGQVLQISDSRVKKNIQPVVSRHHLDNISRLKLYSYQLATGGGSGEISPTPEEGTRHRTQVGLLAQEVQQVIPDAVMETNAEAKLSDGVCVKNLLMVDKDQVLMETIGAVQELKILTNKLSEQVNVLKKAQAQPCLHDLQQSPWGHSKLWIANTMLIVIVVLLLFI